MEIRPFKLKEIAIKDGWLIPDDRVSFNNCSMINLNNATHINYYKNTSYDQEGIERGKSYYITFGNDCERWWCKDEQTAIELYNDIMTLLYQGNVEKVELKETN